MKMDCRTASLLISRRIDGEIEKHEAEALERHLDACAVCRNERAEQERLAGALAALEVPDAPADMGEHLRRAVSEHAGVHAARQATSPGFRIMALAAMLLLVVGLFRVAAELEESRAESDRLASALQAARQRPVSSPGRHHALGIAPDEAQVVRQLQAFRATRDYLGGAARWMVTDGDQVEIGMGAGPASQAAAEDAETIVLNLEYRDIVRGRPRVVSSPEFVMFSGDEVSVRLRGRSPGEPILRYRIFAERLIGGEIRAEVNFANEAISSQEMNGSLAVRTLLTPGKPVLVGAGGTSDRRWELYMWGVARPTGYEEPQMEVGSL